MSSELSSITGKSNYSKNIVTYSVILITFLVALWLSSQSEGPSKMPKVVTDEFTFTAWVNDGEDYLKKNYRWFTKIIAGYIKNGYYFLEDFLIDSPWLLIAAIIFLPCLIAGGLRLGLYSGFVIYFWGATGMGTQREGCCWSWPRGLLVPLTKKRQRRLQVVSTRVSSKIRMNVNFFRCI